MTSLSPWLLPALALAVPPPDVRPAPLPAPPPVHAARAAAGPADPGDAAARPAAPAPGGPAGSAALASPASARCQPMQGKFLLAFNRAEIVDVLEQASRWTCRNFAYADEVAKGRITLVSKTPVTAEEAWAAFLAALSANNLALYPSGRYERLVRSADAKKAPIPTVTDGGEVPATEQPVTKLIRLRWADPDQLRTLLGNFTSPQGADVQVLAPDLLIVTDLGLNLRRIERLVEAVDRPGGGDLVRMVQVQYASARDLAEKVNQIFQQTSSGKPGARRPLVGVAAPAPGTPAAAPAAQPAELSLSKVLADERTNQLIVLADEKSFGRILDLVKQLDVPTAGTGGIHVVFLKNANAEELAQTLQALAQGSASARKAGSAPAAQAAPGSAQAPAPAAAAAPRPASAGADLLSGEVKVTADKSQNALVVMASGGDFAVVTRLIDELDRPRRQVFVEAAIMEVNLDHESQLGVSMHGISPIQTAGGTGYVPLGSETGRVNSLDVSSLLSLGGFLTGVVAPVSAELKSIFPYSSAAILVQALQTSSDVNVLSTPHLLASDNEESEISVGQNVPFQAGYSTAATSTSASSTSTLASLLGTSSLYAPIQRQNVELKLKLKPQISEGDMVRLDLEEQTEEIASKDAVLGPTTAKRSVKTRIVVKDQSTVVIGGLIQERTLQSVHKVPLLGDLPLLGWLFRDTTSTKTKTNLLLFLTPYVIRDASDFRRILEKKRREQEEFTRRFQGQARGYEPPVDWARKPGVLTRLRRDLAEEARKVENGGPGAPGEGVVTPNGGRAAPPAGASGKDAPAVAPPDRARGPGAHDAPAPAPPDQAGGAARPVAASNTPSSSSAV